MFEVVAASQRKYVTNGALRFITVRNQISQSWQRLGGPLIHGLETTLGGLYPPASVALVSIFRARSIQNTLRMARLCSLRVELLKHPIIWKTKHLNSYTEIKRNTMTMTEQHQPMYRTATIRKLKRTHEDTHFDSNEFMRTSTLKTRSHKPILRSASVIKTRHIKENLCSYGSYTDDQPENLIFRRGKCCFCVDMYKEGRTGVLTRLSMTNVQSPKLCVGPWKSTTFELGSTHS